MKIKTLLENAYPNADLQFSDLTPVQIGVLMKMSRGEIDVDSADDRQFDIMNELRGLGLIDQDWALSREGAAAARYAEETGGSHDLQQARDRANREVTDVEFDDIDTGSDRDFSMDSLVSVDGDDEIDFSVDDAGMTPDERKRDHPSRIR